MKNKLYFFSILTLLTTIFIGCTEEIEPTKTPFATFETNSVILGVQEAGEMSKDIKVFTANITNTDRVLEVVVKTDDTTADPASYTISPSVTIPAGSNEGVVTLTFKDIELGVVNEDKVLKLKLQETDDIFVGEELTASLEQLCPNNGSKVKVSLGFDSWPEEAAWRILDSNGTTVMASADPFAYGAYDGMSGELTTPAVCLEPGTYTIQVYDGYGDGGTDYDFIVNGVTVYSLTGDYGGFQSTQITL